MLHFIIVWILLLHHSIFLGLNVPLLKEINFKLLNLDHLIAWPTFSFDDWIYIPRLIAAGFTFISQNGMCLSPPARRPTIPNDRNAEHWHSQFTNLAPFWTHVNACSKVQRGRQFQGSVFVGYTSLQHSNMLLKSIEHGITRVYAILANEDKPFSSSVALLADRPCTFLGPIPFYYIFIVALLPSVNNLNASTFR